MMHLLADIDPGPWSSWAQIAAVLGGLALFLWRIARTLMRRLDTQDRDIAEIKATLQTNFGPNNGGLREKVNGIADRLDDHIELHSERQRH